MAKGMGGLSNDLNRWPIADATKIRMEHYQTCEVHAHMVRKFVQPGSPLPHENEQYRGLFTHIFEASSDLGYVDFQAHVSVSLPVSLVLPNFVVSAVARWNQKMNRDPWRGVLWVLFVFWGAMTCVVLKILSKCVLVFCEEQQLIEYKQSRNTSLHIDFISLPTIVMGKYIYIVETMVPLRCVI